MHNCSDECKWFSVTMVTVVKHSLAIPSLFYVYVQMNWMVNSTMQNTIILLVEQIAVALGGEFKVYMPQLIPHMLRIFMHDNSTVSVACILSHYNLSTLTLILLMMSCTRMCMFITSRASHAKYQYTFPIELR